MSRYMNRFLTLALIASPFVSAGPVQVGQGAFTSPTVLNFNTIGNEVSITNQYAGQGATFSGGIFGLTNFGDTSQFPGTPTSIASDWLYSQSAHGSLPITVTFSATQNLVGFLDEVNAGDTTVISTFLNGVPDGSVTLLSSGLTAVFLGVSDTTGFNSITINVTGPGNHFIGLDNFEFQGSATGTPEPATLGLLAAGFGMIGLLRTKRRIR